MVSTEFSFNMKIPGKVVINGSYIVLEKERATVITLDKYFDARVTISPSSKFNLFLEVENREKFNFETCGPDHWLYAVLTTALEYIKVENVIIRIKGKFDDGFFLENGQKLGLGSSACLYVSALYSLMQVGKVFRPLFIAPKILSEDLPYDRNTVGLLHTVNKILIPASSGCDIMACYLGPINYSRISISRCPQKETSIILGSFGLSTSTRKMLDLIKNVKWDKLKKINNRLIDNENCYEEYLDEMRNCKKEIVPDRQYDILKETFKKDIISCGISGAGGEDAVWCLTENVEEIREFWSTKFTYVVVCKLVDHGIIIS